MKLENEEFSGMMKKHIKNHPEFLLVEEKRL
jgi:hypothetical protein